MFVCDPSDKLMSIKMYLLHGIISYHFLSYFVMKSEGMFLATWQMYHYSTIHWLLALFWSPPPFGGNTLQMFCNKSLLLLALKWKFLLMFQLKVSVLTDIVAQMLYCFITHFGTYWIITLLLLLCTMFCHFLRECSFQHNKWLNKKACSNNI